MVKKALGEEWVVSELGVDVFNISTCLVWAIGSVEAKIELIGPNPSGDVSNQGAFFYIRDWEIILR